MTNDDSSTLPDWRMDHIIQNIVHCSPTPVSAQEVHDIMEEKGLPPRKRKLATIRACLCRLAASNSITRTANNQYTTIKPNYTEESHESAQA